jgi:hypothetical protein
LLDTDDRAAVVYPWSALPPNVEDGPLSQRGFAGVFPLFRSLFLARACPVPNHQSAAALLALLCSPNLLVTAEVIEDVVAGGHESGIGA